MPKIISWNVNGIQSIVSKDIFGNKRTKMELKQLNNKTTLSNLLEKEDPDILCLQEIRCSGAFDHIPYLPNYPHVYTNYSKTKKGYSGTLIATKILAVNVYYDFSLLRDDLIDHTVNDEGRTITIEYDDYFLVNVYVPNIGVKTFDRLNFRINVWEPTFRKYVNKLQETKPVIIVGDFNCIHRDIDGYKTGLCMAGATQEEKEAFTLLLDECNLKDSFRQHGPTDRRYTWFATKTYSHGLRLDYALVSNSIDIKDANILAYIRGSDHVPILLEIE
jgi:exodeoxyribonuclease-3